MIPRSAIVMLMISAVHSFAQGEDPTAKIDREIAAGWEQAEVSAAAECSDAPFVRRAYLDLAGRIPTPRELSSYTEDTRPEKRAELIDQLLHSEDYVQHFTDTFDTLLMGRGSSGDYAKRRKNQWRSWLERVFRDNQPWNQVVTRILLARPESEDDTGAVWFLYERHNDHQKMAEAIAPAFFGIRIECAQCHDHMLATEIEQAHYWGLVAFFNRSTNQDTSSGPRVAESAIGGFSEFANLEGSTTPNLLTFFGADRVDEQRPDAGSEQQDKEELYVAASLKSDPRVPVFSRRDHFVRDVVADHPLIARAFVNRVWAMLMGRGIVHPFDEMDSTHDPSHPELLDWLADDFRQSGHDIRRLVRAIALSRPYRLSSRKPDGIDDPALFSWSIEKPLTAEQLTRSVATALRGQTTLSKETSSLHRPLRTQMPDVLPTETVATVRTALFLSNNPALNQFIEHSNQPEHLIPQLLQLPSSADRVAMLFQTLYGRLATQDEQQTIHDYLEADPSRLNDRLNQVTWSMLTSAEFQFNH